MITSQKRTGCPDLSHKNQQRREGLHQGTPRAPKSEAAGAGAADEEGGGGDGEEEEEGGSGSVGRVEAGVGGGHERGVRLSDLGLVVVVADGGGGGCASVGRGGGGGAGGAG